MVRVRVHSSLNCYLPAAIRERTFDANPGEAPDLEKLLEILRIPEDAVAIFVVNGKAVDRSDCRNFKLSDNDEVQFFPAISGG